MAHQKEYLVCIRQVSGAEYEFEHDGNKILLKVNKKFNPDAPSPESGNKYIGYINGDWVNELEELDKETGSTKTHTTNTNTFDIKNINNTDSIRQYHIFLGNANNAAATIVGGMSSFEGKVDMEAFFQIRDAILKDYLENHRR